DVGSAIVTSDFDRNTLVVRRKAWISVIGNNCGQRLGFATAIEEGKVPAYVSTRTRAARSRWNVDQGPGLRHLKLRGTAGKPPEKILNQGAPLAHSQRHDN